MEYTDKSYEIIWFLFYKFGIKRVNQWRNICGFLLRNNVASNPHFVANAISITLLPSLLSMNMQMMCIFAMRVAITHLFHSSHGHYYSSHVNMYSSLILNCDMRLVLLNYYATSSRYLHRDISVRIGLESIDSFGQLCVLPLHIAFIVINIGLIHNDVHTYLDAS
eukprot:721795_1